MGAAAGLCGPGTSAPVLCKPNKRCYELVLKQIGASDPSTVVFVDDSIRNITAAHELGIFSVLVRAGFLWFLHVIYQTVSGKHPQP